MELWTAQNGTQYSDPPCNLPYNPSDSGDRDVDPTPDTDGPMLGTGQQSPTRPFPTTPWPGQNA